MIYLCWTPARNSAFCTGQYLISVQFNIGNIIIELNFCCQSDQAYIIFINSEAFQIRTGLRLWQYRLSSFQAGYTKLERFLPKNQHNQRKLLNFENWVNEEVSKGAKVWLSKSIFYVKNHRNLSQFFFPLKNTNLGAHFFVIGIFWQHHFLNHFTF